MIPYNPTIQYQPRVVDVPSGWMGIERIFANILTDFAVSRDLAIEFGVEYGYSTAVLANYFARVIGVDTFTGDAHSRLKSNHMTHTREKLSEFLNITLVRSSFQAFDWAQLPETPGFCHIDIQHFYEDTYSCGEAALGHGIPVVAFHDTELFPEVKQACQDLARKFNLSFYNYTPCCGLGILVA